MCFESFESQLFQMNFQSFSLLFSTSFFKATAPFCRFKEPEMYSHQNITTSFFALSTKFYEILPFGLL